MKCHMCNLNLLVALILGKSQFAVLIVGTNPFLHGPALRKGWFSNTSFTIGLKTLPTFQPDALVFFRAKMAGGWLMAKVALHCWPLPCSLPPHPPHCHTVHHWTGVLGGPRVQADLERGSAAGRLATAGWHWLCEGGTLPGLHLLPASPQQGRQQGAECLWSSLLPHEICGPHFTATANELTLQIHQDNKDVTRLYQEHLL